MSGANPARPNGLCDSCSHQQLVPNTRGSVFSLCLRSRTDERFPRYPPVPVAACAGYEPSMERSDQQAFPELPGQEHG